MCKIGGMFSFERIKNKTLVYNLVRKMLVCMESGGPHATGVALIDSDLNLSWYYKKGVPATEFIDLEVLKNAIFRMNYNIVLLHTRFATHGSPKNNINNHPFYQNDNFLIHNGVLHNYEEINKHFKVTNESECDSETILSSYNSIKDIKKIIHELEGHNAFALFDSSLKKMFIYGSGNEVELMYNKSKNIFLFNTSARIIPEMFSKTETLYKYFKSEKLIDELYPMNREDQELITIDFINEKMKKEFVADKTETEDEANVS